MATMSRTVGLNFFLAAAIIGTSLFLQTSGSVPCTPAVFKCLNGKCIERGWFCDRGNDCGDNSDEGYCDTNIGSCPISWRVCSNRRRCIPAHWWCDGRVDCQDDSDEADCAAQKSLPGWDVSGTELLTLFHRKRKNGSLIDKWGPQLHRIVVALHLADDPEVNPETPWAQEMRYELSIQLLQRFSKEKRLSSQELALYIHALMVTCMDPRDFYGENLVLELRKRVEKGGNYTNPFLVLALCNAGDTMTRKDVDRVVAAYDSQHRPFWTDTQALASMALSCLSSRSGLTIDERTLKDMLQELKKRQFRNGTVDNLRTTSLVIQALLVHDSFKADFDLDAAMGVVKEGVGNNCSLLSAYYALPALSRKSLLNVSSSHCTLSPVTEAEALQKALNVNGDTVAVKYSVWIGDKTNLARTWRLKMRVNETAYDVLETVARIDNRQKVEYNVVEGKPYVTALGGMEDDPEMGTYWFFYLKPPNAEEPEVKEQSPVDVRVQANQEIVLWYKRGQWTKSSLVTESAPSSA